MRELTSLETHTIAAGTDNALMGIVIGFLTIPAGLIMVGYDWTTGQNMTEAWVKLGTMFAITAIVSWAACSCCTSSPS